MQPIQLPYDCFETNNPRLIQADSNFADCQIIVKYRRTNLVKASSTSVAVSSNSVQLQLVLNFGQESVE